MKKLLAIAMSACMMIGFAGCASDSSSVGDTTTSGGGGTTKAAAKGDILVGCLQDVTGATSTLGKMVEAGVKWAVDEINEAGGIDGRKIKVITYDTKGDVNEAINAFTRAVTSDKVSAIVGPPVANMALAIAPISEQYSVPVLGFALDTKAQVKEDGTPYKSMFAFQPNANDQGAIMANYADKNGFKKFGALYNESNAYSTSLLTPFVDTVKANGGEVVAQVAYNANDKDFKTLLNKIIKEDVDAIFVPNYTQDLILIAQQARALGFDGALICGLDACPPFNNLMGEPCDNIYFINNVDPAEEHLQKLVTDVKAKTGIDATNKFFLGYDVAYILSEIFADVGSDSAAVRDAVEKITNYEGLTGSITIDPKTHMPKGLEMVMFKYEGTTPVMLERYSAQQ